MIFCKQLINKEEAIKYFYENEDELFFSVLHKCQGTKEEAIKDTLESFSEETILFGVYEDDVLGGFFGKNGNELNGFHVLKEYRNKDFLNGFWWIVKKLFKDSIETALWEGNSVAVKHLVKNGFEVKGTINYNNKNYKILSWQ